MKVKVLTVKQTWASLIVHGIKDIENRSWSTKFRGRVLIHAAAKGEKRSWSSLSGIQSSKLLQSGSILNKTFFSDLPTGSIIGSVEVVDCVLNHPSAWAEKGVYHWILANPILFEKPIENVKGKLGLWKYDWEEVA
nr:MAG TPA: ASCH domain protein [Caudoviricetes sp.]